MCTCASPSCKVMLIFSNHRPLQINIAQINIVHFVFSVADQALLLRQTVPSNGNHHAVVFQRPDAEDFCMQALADSFDLLFDCS